MHEPGVLVLNLVDTDEKVSNLAGRIGGDPVGEHGKEPDCHGVNIALELLAARFAQREHLLRDRTDFLVSRRRRLFRHDAVLAASADEPSCASRRHMSTGRSFMRRVPLPPR